MRWNDGKDGAERKVCGGEVMCCGGIEEAMVSVDGGAIGGLRW